MGSLQATTTSLELMILSTVEPCSHTRKTERIITPKESTESTFPMVVFRLLPTLLDQKDMLLMSHTRERLSTLRRLPTNQLPMPQHLPQLQLSRLPQHQLSRLLQLPQLLLRLLQLLTNLLQLPTNQPQLSTNLLQLLTSQPQFTTSQLQFTTRPQFITRLQFTTNQHLMPPRNTATLLSPPLRPPQLRLRRLQLLKLRLRKPQHQLQLRKLPQRLRRPQLPLRLPQQRKLDIDTTKSRQTSSTQMLVKKPQVHLSSAAGLTEFLQII